MKKLLLGLTFLVSIFSHADSQEVKVQNLGKNGSFIVTCEDRVIKEKHIYNAVEVYYLNSSSINSEIQNQLFVTFLSEENSRVEHAVSHFETCVVSSSEEN